MSDASKRALVAVGSGILFGAGLLVSGMTQPAKVLGFLDITGQFDASLIFVMVAAIGVHMPAYRWVKRRGAPLYNEEFTLPQRSVIDLRLLIGASLFGAGWGLGGYCPGPAIVSAVGGVQALVFLLAMLAGMLLTVKLEAFFATRRQPFLISHPEHSDMEIET